MVSDLLERKFLKTVFRINQKQLTLNEFVAFGLYFKGVFVIIPDHFCCNFVPLHFQCYRAIYGSNQFNT